MRNIWFIVPVSGLLFGGALGWLQFRGAYLAGAPVGVPIAVALALATMVGYAATDLSTWYTTRVETVSEDGTELATVHLRDVLSFPDYMRIRLASSSIEMRPGRSETSVELGSLAAKASFGFDLLGAWLAALMTLMACARGTPFCRRCDQYKKPQARLHVALNADTALEQLDVLQEHTGRGDYAGLVSHVNELQKAPQEKSPMRLDVDERVCPGCNEATLCWSILQQKGSDWNALATATLNSSTGETARVDG